jgi:tRNA (Thr-GGU) A37 N-methylase
MPLTGVFATRSSERPNPIGLHRVTITAIEAPTRLRVRALEAVDGTPIIDLAPAAADLEGAGVTPYPADDAAANNSCSRSRPLRR